jgi:hypothetical protein
MSSSPPAMSKRFPHSGQKVSEPIMFEGVDIVCYREKRMKMAKKRGNSPER